MFFSSGARRWSASSTAQTPSQQNANQPQVMSVSVAVFPQTPLDILQSRYLRVRAFLVVALAAVVALTYAVVVLATASRPETVTRVKSPQSRADGLDLKRTVAACVASAETGARLDHSGRG
jgi:hypothetical protein